MSQELNTADFGPAEAILDSMGSVSGNELIPILQKLQDSYGYLPPDVLMEVSERTGIPASHIYGLATFYEQFHLEPRGRHTIRCCRGTACHVRGGSTVIDTLKSTLGLEDGQSTEDMMFCLETVACLGACALAPVVVVDGKYYGQATPARIQEILQGIVEEES